MVGGVAAVLAGAPLSTFDLDIVHDRSSPTVARLLLALTDLDARYRDLTGRALRPEAHALEGEGHHLLVTRCGPLDVLGRIGIGRGYDDLLADSAMRPLGQISVRVLGLEALIREKLETDARRTARHFLSCVARSKRVASNRASLVPPSCLP